MVSTKHQRGWRLPAERPARGYEKLLEVIAIDLATQILNLFKRFAILTVVRDDVIHPESILDAAKAVKVAAGSGVT
jgi:hypothetical protein